MFRLLALSALVLSLSACAGKSTEPDSRHPSSDRPEVDCRAVMCPALVPPRCKPNEKITRDGEGCCPRFKCAPKTSQDCARVRCMMKMPKCGEDEVAVDKRPEGACCPQMVCMAKDDGDEDGVTDAEDRCPGVQGPVDNDGCPRPTPACARVRCDGRKPKCEQGQDLVDLREPGACCPKWKCVSPDELTDDAMASEHGEEEEAGEQE